MAEVPAHPGFQRVSPSDLDLRNRGNAILAHDQLERAIESHDEHGLADWSRRWGRSALEGLNHGFYKSST